LDLRRSVNIPAECDKPVDLRRSANIPTFVTCSVIGVANM
jgi:hypothetical protein